MIKSDLVRKIAQQTLHLRLSDVQRAVDAIFDEISAALTRRQRIELRDFGSFSVKVRNAREARNPRTGASFNIAEKIYPAFRAAKQLKARLNEPRSDG